MVRLVGKMLLLFLLVLPTTIMFAGNDGSPSMLVNADVGVADDVEDIIDGEDDMEGDASVETDEGTADTGAETAAAETEEKEEEEEEEKPIKPSPNADTYILFTQPTTAQELPAGKVVKLLVGFANKGDKDFMVDSMDAAFRYPQDYSFYIQNFTTVRYNRNVEPSRHATFEYAFTPSETFNARPFGLAINLNYKDSEGNIFQDAVYNETINVVEPDEGLDGETFFLYIFLAAIAVLLLVGLQQLFTTYGKKKLSRPKPAVEMGTQNKGDIDYAWIPQETLDGLNKSPKGSPRSKTSPRNRRANRNTGAVED